MGICGGTLRKRVQIQSRSTAQDTFGGQSTTWATIATIWAEILELNARELMAAQAVNMEVTHTITVRYQSIFSVPKTVSAYRVLYANRIFNIAGMSNIEERNAMVKMMVSEGLNDG